MTTLQQAARKSFEAWKKAENCFYMSRNNTPGSDLDGYQDAYTQLQWVAWQAALAQQGKEPVLWASKDSMHMWGKSDESGHPFHIITKGQKVRSHQIPLYTSPQDQPITDGEVIKAFGDKNRLAFDRELLKSQAQPVAQPRTEAGAIKMAAQRMADAIDADVLDTLKSKETK